MHNLILRRQKNYFRKKNILWPNPSFENISKENPNHLKASEYLGDIEGVIISVGQSYVLL